MPKIAIYLVAAAVSIGAMKGILFLIEDRALKADEIKRKDEALTNVEKVIEHLQTNIIERSQAIELYQAEVTRRTKENEALSYELSTLLESEPASSEWGGAVMPDNADKWMCNIEQCTRLQKHSPKPAGRTYYANAGDHQTGQHQR